MSATKKEKQTKPAAKSRRGKAGKAEDEESLGAQRSSGGEAEDFSPRRAKAPGPRRGGPAEDEEMDEATNARLLAWDRIMPKTKLPWTPEEIRVALENHVEVDPTQWPLLSFNCSIKYTLRGPEPEAERFRGGGYYHGLVTLGGIEYFQISLNRNANYANKAYKVKTEDVERLWKRLPSSMMIELNMIRRNISDMKAQIATLSDAFLNLRREFIGAKAPSTSPHLGTSSPRETSPAPQRLGASSPTATSRPRIAGDGRRASLPPFETRSAESS